MTVLYLQWNLLLAISFFLFRFLSGSSLRIGQGVLALAIALPLLFSFLPRETLPPLPEEVLQPLAEMGENFRPTITKVVTSAPVQAEALPTSVPIDWNGILISTWATFTGVFGLWIVIQALRLRSLLRRSVTLRAFGKVRIVLSSEITIPFSTRLGGYAWVAIPEALLSRWKDLRIAVAHELQHHRQGDTRWAWALEGLTVLFVFNPFMHLWKRKIHELQELSCDEALIGHKLSSYEYGSCLVRVAEAALGARPMWVGTAGMAAGFGNSTYFKSFLSRRIEMLANYSKRKRPGRALALGTLTFLATFVAAYGAQQIRRETASGQVGQGEITVEPEIQKIAETALDAALLRHKASLGFVVVSDPATGRILAVANKDLVEKGVPRTPHWALSLQVGPASIAKAFIAAAAIDKGATTVDEKHACENGKFEWGGRVYRDWKSFSILTTREMVAHSSNICGIKVGKKLGAVAVAQAFKDFGFGPGGSAAGFPESRSGELPESSDEPLYVATVSTGYNGVFITPIEMVQAFGAIANGGNLLQPQFGSEVSPKIIRRVLTEDTSKKMREILQDTLIYGTARQSGSKLYKLAGKTATGYSRTHVDHDSLGGDSNMASFVGFAPADSPRVVIYVVVENPTDMKGVHGSYHAAPVFKEVAEKTLQYLKVPAG